MVTQSTDTKVGNATEIPKPSFAMKVANRMTVKSRGREKTAKERKIVIETCMPMFAQDAMVAEWFYTDSPVTEPGTTTEIPLAEFRSFLERTGLLDKHIDPSESKELSNYYFFMIYQDEKFIEEGMLMYLRKELGL